MPTIVCSFDSHSCIPPNTVPVASVMMNGLTSKRTMITPLITPHSRPTASPMRMQGTIAT